MRKARPHRENPQTGDRCCPAAFRAGLHVFAAQARGALLADAPLALQLGANTFRSGRTQPLIQIRGVTDFWQAFCSTTTQAMHPLQAAVPLFLANHALAAIHEDIRVRRPSVPEIRCFPIRRPRRCATTSTRNHMQQKPSKRAARGQAGIIGSNAPHPNDESAFPATRCRQPRDCARIRKAK